MKKIFYFVAVLLACTGCENFLDTENLKKKDTTNFPKTATDAEGIISGIYSTLNSTIIDPSQTYLHVAEMASDERFGGGGADDKAFMATGHLMNMGPDQYKAFWEGRYKGIFRSNTAILTLDNCEIPESDINRYKGEAYFLRAFFYHEMVEMFGEVPLVLTSEPINIPRTSVELIYGQIAYDLKQAIALLPSKTYNTIESGHATKWAAQALMARVFLFYTGFYEKTEMPLGNGEGENTGKISKTEVIDWIDDCIHNSGHDLVDDYRRLWPYSNELTASEYDFVSDLAKSGKTWIGDGSGNPEHMFVIKMSNLANWNGLEGYSNRYALYYGLRQQGGHGGEDTFPFGFGWGAGPVNSTLWKDWLLAEPDDIRRTASILHGDSECDDYIYGADNQMEETGYWQKKYINIRAHDNEGTLRNVFYSILYSNDDDYMIRNLQDMVIIRFADVLLMQSELKEDAEGMNRVRVRANLPKIGYSLDALKRERRFELAFEGRRWGDIRRWGDAVALLEKKVGVEIYNRGEAMTMKDFGDGYVARYNATKGFFPIPQSEIDLSEGVLKQTSGWGTAKEEFTGW